MWDQWEQALKGYCVGTAVLPGYRRCLCILEESGRWGTTERPGLVLGLVIPDLWVKLWGLVPDDATRTEGTLFAFPFEERSHVESYLRSREGPTHPLGLATVRLVDSSKVSEIEAIIAMNGNDPAYFAGTLAATERVKLLRNAKGSAGTGIDYLLNLARHLNALAIDDPEISELARLVTMTS